MTTLIPKVSHTKMHATKRPYPMRYAWDRAEIGHDVGLVLIMFP